MHCPPPSRFTTSQGKHDTWPLTGHLATSDRPLPAGTPGLQNLVDPATPYIHSRKACSLIQRRGTESHGNSGEHEADSIAISRKLRATVVSSMNSLTTVAASPSLRLYG
ncbi:hypothetical protein KM043_002651 [Ampulex compressa]|nr:hypothetical protein KM043_002651 [Ampulex compressa]